MIRKRLFPVFFLAIAFAACSGDNGTTPGDGDGNNNGGGSVTRDDTLRVLALQDLATRLNDWSALSPDTIAARTLAWLDQLPAVTHAGITPGTTTIWATFADGFNLVIPNNREPSSMADTLVDARYAPPPAGMPRRLTIPAGRSAMKTLRVETQGLELPSVPRFRAVNAIGTCHIDPLPGIRSLLTAGHYQNAQPGPPTVANLKNVRGDGVFYINSHGGVGYDAQQNPYYAVWTLDPIDLATLANYKPMVDAKEVVGMLETSNDAQGNCAKVMHYGITSAFVNRYMTFAKNSLVIVDACYSGTPQADALRQAFKAKGASLYVGWTDRVGAGHAYAAMKYLLDRILGLNQISPESPKQRAFNIFDIRDDMASHTNLVQDPTYGAVLTLFKLKDDFGVLTPSIKFLSIESSTTNDRLLIAGLFGTDPGAGKRSVTIGGTELVVVSWEPTFIQCELPDDAAGTVVVAVGEGSTALTSNEVNLTKWEAELVYHRDDPGDMQATMTMKVPFRADIHAFRDLPHETPWETTVLFNWMHNASLGVTTSGSYSQTLGECSDQFDLLRGTSLGQPGEPTPDGSWYYFGSVDTQARKLRLGMQVILLFNAGHWEHSGTAECAPFGQDIYAGIQLEPCLFDDTVGTTAFGMPMNDDFSVPSGDRGPCDTVPLMAPLAGTTALATVHWELFTPSYPPDPDAAR